MNKHSRIILLIIILVLSGVFLYFLKIRDLDSESKFGTKFIMRNLSWDSDFRTSVPYKKGDEVEYAWVFSGNSPREVSVDTTPLANTLTIERIEFDGEAIEEKALRQLRITGSSLLKIVGKAKNTSNNEAIIQPMITTQETEEKVIREEEPMIKTLEAEPTETYIVHTRYNSNINNLLAIQGNNLDVVEFVNIGEKRIRSVYSTGTLLVRIDRDTFASGEYFVFFTLKNGKIITTEHRLSFVHSDSPINIANITPNTLQNDQDRFVVIQGNGFHKIISIQLSNNLILKNTEFRIINNQVAGVKIPKDLPVGTYYFNIMDTGSIHELTDIHLTITHP